MVLLFEIMLTFVFSKITSFKLRHPFNSNTTGFYNRHYVQVYNFRDYLWPLMYIVGHCSSLFFLILKSNQFLHKNVKFGNFEFFSCKYSHTSEHSSCILIV